MLGDLDCIGFGRLHRLREILTELPPIITVSHYYADFIISKPVYMVLINKELGIVNQILTDLLLPERKSQPASFSLIGKIETVVVVAMWHVIKEVDTFI